MQFGSHNATTAFKLLMWVKKVKKLAMKWPFQIRLLHFRHFIIHFRCWALYHWHFMLTKYFGVQMNVSSLMPSSWWTFFKSLCQFCSHALLSAVISQDPFTFSFYLWISFEPKIDSLFTELEKWCWLTFKKIISIWDSKMICWRCEVSKWMFLSM